MDIQQLFQDAKNDILKNGRHAPVLYAENRDGAITLFYFLNLPDTTQEKQYMLFGYGREHGIAHPGNPLTNLYFICEMWTSFTKVGQKSKYRFPSEDPNRKEVIGIVHLDTITGKSAMHRAEMLRSADGTLIDLLVLDGGKDGEMCDHLLPTFLAGFLSAKMSDKELAQALTGQK